LPTSETGKAATLITVEAAISEPRVYIPNLNGGTGLLDVLGALAEQTAATRVVVIDNGSEDGSARDALNAFPDVELLELGRNLGFGRAINAGVAEFPGDPVILLNNDAVCEPGFVEAMLEQSGAGDSVAGVMLSHQDRSLIDSAGVEADSTLFAFDYLHADPVGALVSAAPPLGPTGGAALYPLEAFEAVGGFDEEIFAYLEDVDLALRMSLEGIECRLAADARTVHAHSATLGSGSSAKNALMGWSRGYLLGRYRILSRPLPATRAIACETVIAGGQLVVDRTASGIAARVRGWRRGRSLPARAVPAGVLSEIGALQALRVRSRRRR
jgi:N-acetylglucosaminyl-diphospho-decaprenol L-rhamnosyltransferase